MRGLKSIAYRLSRLLGEASYDALENIPALSSYFELMDRVLPGFLSTLSNQKLRGTRTLLK